MKKFLLVGMSLVAGLMHGMNSGSAITTDYHAGRFGDQLLLYYDAKYLSWLLDVPFLYKPFEYSDQLMLHEKEMQYTPEIARSFYTKKTAPQLLVRNDPCTLYELRFGTGLNFPPTTEQNNADFLAHMRSMIAPRSTVNYIELPKDIMSVAVHVRKGGGFDSLLISQQEYTDQDLRAAQYKSRPSGRYQDVLNPEKFPPDQFYIDQIKRLSEMFNNVPMYVFIFTDDQNPEQIANRYKDRVGKANIIFDSRKNNNRFGSTMLDDFFSMMKFDCLIRPESAFSIIAQRIGFCKIAISPKKVRWVGTILHVEEVETSIKDTLN